MTDPHAPSPTFLAHLERETRFALRRPAGTAASSGPLSTVGSALARLRAAALVVVSLSAGAGVVLAAEHVQDSRRAERALAANRVHLALAAKRAEALRGLAERARVQHAAGMVGASEQDEAQRRLVAAERALRHMELEREAIGLGAEPLRRGGGLFAGADLGGDDRFAVALDLTAPLVGRRDFVAEHLRVDREALADHLTRARREAERTRALAENGMVPVLDRGVAELALADTERALAAVDRRLALRADFLLGRLTRDECLRQDLLVGAESRRGAAEGRLTLQRRQLEVAEALRVSGVGPAPDALRLGVAEVEAELELLALELDALR